jgi:nicotinamide riboside kinase
MKIAISGVQCTGKSTVLKELQKMPELLGYEFIFEGIRNLKNQGKIKINEDGNDNTQIVIANFHKDNLLKENVVLDRCILDCYAYSLYSYQKGMISKDTLDAVTEIYNETVNQYDVILYLRPEFEMIEDGVRSLNKEFRDKVLKNFESLIKNLKNVVVLSGTVENRVNQFKALMRTKVF